MKASEVQRAVAAATSIAAALDLTADDAIVLRNSNKLALRVLPCDLFARVAHVGQEVAQFEVDLAQRLAETGSPVAVLTLECRRASTSVTASRSRYGPTTSLYRLETSRQPSTRRRSRGCTLACGKSISLRRTLRIESQRRSGWLATAPTLRSSEMRTGSS